MVPNNNHLIFQVQVFFEKEEGGGYHAFAPSLKGLHSSGDTVEEAKKHIGDALVAYLSSMIKHGDPIPLSCVHHGDKPTAKKQALKSQTLTHEFLQVAV